MGSLCRNNSVFPFRQERNLSIPTLTNFSGVLSNTMSMKFDKKQTSRQRQIYRGSRKSSVKRVKVIFL